MKQSDRQTYRQKLTVSVTETSKQTRPIGTLCGVKDKDRERFNRLNKISDNQKERANLTREERKIERKKESEKESEKTKTKADKRGENAIIFSYNIPNFLLPLRLIFREGSKKKSWREIELESMGDGVHLYKSALAIKFCSKLVSSRLAS